MNRLDLTKGQLIRGINPDQYANGLQTWVGSLGDDKSTPWKGQYHDKDGNLKGKPDKGSAENALRALFNLDYRDTIKLNEWTGKIQLLDRHYNGKSDLTQIMVALEGNFASIGYLPYRKAIDEGIQGLAAIQQHNPRLAEIKSEEWDEIDRWPRFAMAMQQDPTDQVPLEICKLLVRGIVVRVLKPGAKFPYCPVIYSPHQGSDKTQVLQVLAQGHYAEMDRGLLSGVGDSQRTIMERMRGRSVVELGEFNGIRGNAMDRLKSLVTTGSLNGVREVYAHGTEDWPVTAIIVGTTNNHDVLTDTEHRRNPILTVADGKKIDLGWVYDNRAQLYAQAVYEYEVTMVELIQLAQNAQGGVGLVGGKMDDSIGMVFNRAEELTVRIPDCYWVEVNERSDEHRETSPVEEYLKVELSKYAPEEMLLGTDLLTFAKQKVGVMVNRDFSEAMKVCGWVKRQAPVGAGGKKLSVWGRPGATKHVDLRYDPVSLIPQ